MEERSREALAERVGDPDASATQPWWFTWAVARVIGLAVVYLGLEVTGSDPVYYVDSLRAVSTLGWSVVLPEYPLPLAVLVWPLAPLADLGIPPWLLVALLLLVVDLAFCAVLHRRIGPRASTVWIVGVLLVGPVALQRLDLVPGVVVGLSLIACGPALSGLWIALGTASKVFPLVTLPTIAAGSSRPRAVVISTGAAGVLMALACVLVGGFDRLLSPVRYQTARGLQDESIVATPFMVLRLFDPRRWPTGYSASSKSYEVAGPGVQTAMTLAQVGLLALLAAVTTLVVVVVRRRRSAAPPDHLALRSMTLWATIAVVCGLVVTSRVFSPQYLLWVLPVVAVAHGSPSRALRIWTRALMVCLVLTQLLYPVLYGGLLESSWATTPAILGLTARNVILLVLTVVAVRRAFLAVRAPLPIG